MQTKKVKILGIFILLVGIILGNVVPASFVARVFAAEEKPVVATLSATGITQTSATLQGQLNPNGVPTSYWFEYGTTPSLGSRTSVQAGGLGSSSFQVSATISGLSMGTTYYFRISAQNQYGRSDGSVNSFVTLSNNTSSPSAPTSDQGTTPSDQGVSDSSGSSSGGNSLNNESLSLALPIVPTSPIFNNDPNDKPTLRISNYTKNSGSTAHWSTETQGEANDIISFDFYYHNNSTVTAKNTRIAIAFEINPITETIRAIGTLGADNASTVTGYATLSVQGNPNQPWNMVYDSAVWYPNQGTVAVEFPSGQSGEKITQGGINIGDIAGGWSSQGHVVVRFKFVAASDSADNTGSAPSVTTLPANNISSSAATVHAHVNPNNKMTTLWFEYGTTQSLGQRTMSQTISSEQTIDTVISGLQANTTYYYRASAQNEKGRTNGIVMQFTTSNSTAGGGDVGAQPTVVTREASHITTSGALVNGQLNSNGIPTSYWFEYGTTQSLGLRTAVQSGGSENNFNQISASISGLEKNTLYYYRLAAQNSKGRSYGAIMSFTTVESGGSSGSIAPVAHTDIPDNIGSSSALLVGHVNTNGLPGSLWFEYGTTESLGWRTAIQAIQSTTMQSGVATISGLTPSTRYCYRIAAQNSNGRTYGDIECFTTLSTGGGGGSTTTAPIVQTITADQITSSGARLQANVNAGNLPTSYWFEYGTTQSLGLRTAVQSISGSNSQIVQASLSNLSSLTQYCYRIVAQNSKGRTSGTIECFTTLSAGGGGGSTTTAPVAQTIGADSITTNSSRLNGHVVPGGLPTSYWFEYGTTQSLGLRTAVQSINTIEQNVYSSISGLKPSTVYYYRIAAKNSKGTTYGSVLNFQTLSTTIDNRGVPIVTTNNASNVTQTTALLQGTVDPHGYGTEYWFEYGTSLSALSNVTTRTSLGSVVDTQSISYTISGLSAGTTYYFRVVAQNSAGQAAGAILSFTTASSSGGGGGSSSGGSSSGGGGSRGPLVQTDNFSNVSLTQATLYGSVLPNGSDSYVWFEYGLSKDNLINKTSEQSIENDFKLVPFNATISDLEAGKTYYFRAVGRNITATSYGHILSFNTFGTAVAGKLPVVTTKAPTFVSQNSGLVNATVNPRGSETVAWFEYGTTAALGIRTPEQKVGSGTADANVSYALTGLIPNTTYFYRAVAKNSYGTVYSYILAINTTVGRPTGTVNRTTTVVTASTAGEGSNASCLLVVPAATPEYMNAGEDFTYVLTYRNGCLDSVQNVFLKIIVPAESEVISQSTSRGTFQQNVDGITYALGTLRSGEQGAVTIQGKIGTGVNKGDILIFSSIFNYTDSQNHPQSISSYLTAEVVSGKTLTASIFDAFGKLFTSGWFALLLLIIIGFLVYWIFFRSNNDINIEEKDDELDVLKA